MSALSFLLVLAGVLLLLLAAVGLFRLPDAMTRQHAATKSVTLALGLILWGVAAHTGDGGFFVRIIAMVVLLLATLPVASHMLARAAARHAYSSAELENAPYADQGDVPEVESPEPGSPT